MKMVYFLANSKGDSVFGVPTQSHGQLPAFFTDEHIASKFFANMIPADQQDQHTFARCDDFDSVRRFLNYNEMSYVLLDFEPMTGVEMFDRLKQ